MIDRRCRLLTCPVWGLLSLAAMTSASVAAKTCDDRTSIQFTRKAELPKEVLAALNLDLAELGKPFRMGDVIAPGGAGLPTRRFVSAQQIGCRLTLNYEEGGWSYRRAAVVFENVAGRWSLLRSQTTQ